MRTPRAGPGIVDIHTHYDAQLTWDPWATPSVGLGVTTVVIGNCGFTIAPCREQDRDRTLRNLTHVEGMSLERFARASTGASSRIRSTCACSRRRGRYRMWRHSSDIPLYAPMCWVMKHPSAPLPPQKSEMKKLVLAMAPVGFASSTLEQHNGEAGIPMPSRLADDHEMRELTGALGEAGRGVFMVTKGMTTTIPWLEDIAAANGRPVMVAAMFIDPNDPERVFREIGQISDARSRGRELWAQVGCFPLGMEFTLRHPYPLEAFLAWRPAILAEGSEAFARVLSDPEFRSAIKAEASTATVPNRFSYHTFETLTVMQVADSGIADMSGSASATSLVRKEKTRSTGCWTLGLTVNWTHCSTANYSIQTKIGLSTC